MFGKVDFDNPKELFTVSQAAQYLGVSPNTVRNWDRAGKLTAIRHPMNKYRLYKKKQLELIRRKLT